MFPFRRAIQNAFGYWSAVSPLEFSETSSPYADIKISFASGDHGDGYPFDNRGNGHSRNTKYHFIDSCQILAVNLVSKNIFLWFFILQIYFCVKAIAQGRCLT